MKNALGPPLLYVSFDNVSAAKGASTHIEANARAVGSRFGSLILVTPGSADGEVRPFAEGVRHLVLGCPDQDLIGRVMTFRVKLAALLRRQVFDLIHFRSPLEGYPIVRSGLGVGARLLYEVNGLPSIEWKYRHPRLIGDGRLQARLRHQEAACLQGADRIVTISETTRRCLECRGGEREKITVLRNGVDLDVFTYRDPRTLEDGPLRVLYQGTFGSWQGVEVLLEALPLMVVERPVHLTLVGPVSRRRRDELMRPVHRRGLSGCVRFHGPVDRTSLVDLLHEAHACVVPLRAVDRNTEQGCCPLKLIEALATGCPVVASDLPVVRELATPGEHYLPVAPDDPAGLALTLLRLAGTPADAIERARRGRRHVESHLSWGRSTDQLLAVYEELLATPARMASRAVRSAGRE